MSLKRISGTGAFIVGSVIGSDGKTINGFTVEGQDEFGETQFTQNFANGIWQLSVDTSLDYYFTGMPVYGAVGIAGAKLTNGMVVTLPLNFVAPVPSQGSMDAFYLIGGGLAIVAIANEAKKSKKSKVGKVGPGDVETLLLIGAGVLGVSLVSKLFTSLGIFDSAATKNLDAAASSSNTFWSPTYYTQFTTYSYTIDTPTATTLANQIYNAMGIFNDDEDAVFAAFRTLKTKSNVSFLAKVFSDIYSQDLLTFLRGGIWPQDHLSDADVNTINSFLSQLPTN